MSGETISKGYVSLLMAAFLFVSGCASTRCSSPDAEAIYEIIHLTGGDAPFSEQVLIFSNGMATVSVLGRGKKCYSVRDLEIKKIEDILAKIQSLSAEGVKKPHSRQIYITAVGPQFGVEIVNSGEIYDHLRQLDKALSLIFPGRMFTFYSETESNP